MRFFPSWLSLASPRKPQPEPKVAPTATILESIVVNFAGLVIVSGATETRQVRYTMELINVEARAKVQCSKRFSQFLAFRTALLAQLKAACGCRRCAAVRNELKAVPFPSRHWPARLRHINDRALPLEAFLQRVLDVALEYTGCSRSKQEFHDVTSQFVGAPMSFKRRSRPTVLDFRASLRSILAATEIEAPSSPSKQSSDESIKLDCLVSDSKEAAAVSPQRALKEAISYNTMAPMIREAALEEDDAKVVSCENREREEA
ncbi:hypothetical protein ACHHYP_03368 [Achlya hypogyna]|uniref:PX domain-containing protein n=1 Tax=Achlya hypogyna TaxID=1202772 RepID=A0A1V9Z3S5_ACHHY|nr:hypothetical protein ACHHYP_03368 [Achlya hypogyna]